MDNKLVYLMREINKNIAIESRIYGEFSSKQKYNNIEARYFIHCLFLKMLLKMILLMNI